MFEDCFDKHSFEELNDIDIHMLHTCFQFYLNKFQNTNTTFFDIGTNAGSFVKLLQYFNIYQNIHCFEPHPILSSKTKELYPHIHMNDYCLSDTNGNIDIYIPQWSVGISSIINRPVFSTLNQKINKLNVKCETLDTYCKLNNIEDIGFIKIDVEGAEKKIFEGAHNMLKDNKIKCGVFEIGTTLHDAGTNEDEIVNLLNSYGYNIHKTLVSDNYLFYL